MTYRTLLKRLNALNDEQLSADVTVVLDSEFYRMSDTHVTLYDDILNPDHFIITDGWIEGIEQ